jgi:hypothetical protein
MFLYLQHRRKIFHEIWPASSWKWNHSPNTNSEGYRIWVYCKRDVRRNTRISQPTRAKLIYLLTSFGPPLWSSAQSSWLESGDVLCFLWGMNWIYICYVEESRPLMWSSGQSSWLHNGDVLCFLWGTNWIYICYVEESRPPLWSNGQSSWLQYGDVLCFLWGTNWIYIC